MDEFIHVSSLMFKTLNVEFIHQFFFSCDFTIIITSTFTKCSCIIFFSLTYQKPTGNWQESFILIDTRYGTLNIFFNAKFILVINSPPGGYSSEFWVGVCCQTFINLTLFQTSNGLIQIPCSKLVMNSLAVCMFQETEKEEMPI